MIQPQCSNDTLKVPISCLGILHICNLWILLRKIVIYLVDQKCYLRGLFCCWSRRKWRHSRNLLIAKTHSYRHTENIPFDFESNRYYSMKINKFSNLLRVCILKHSGVPTMTSLPSTLTARKSTNINFSIDKIYYNFSQEYPKITNI